MQNTTTKTHGELKDGDKVFVQGHLMRVENVRVAARKGEPRIGDEVNTDDVIRFEGHCVREDDDVKGTGYDGGTYGAYAFVQITVQVEG